MKKLIYIILFCIFAINIYSNIFLAPKTTINPKFKQKSSKINTLVTSTNPFKEKDVLEFVFDSKSKVSKFINKRQSIIKSMKIKIRPHKLKIFNSVFLGDKNEYEFRVLDSFIDEIDIGEEFYENSKQYGHGYTRAMFKDNSSLEIRMGYNNLTKRHKSRMKKSNMFEAKLKYYYQKFHPIAYVVPNNIENKYHSDNKGIRDFETFMFYIRKGFLPTNPDCRKLVINYLEKWLNGEINHLDNKGFADFFLGGNSAYEYGFLNNTGDFVFYLDDPRIKKVQKSKSKKHSISV